MRSLIGLLSVAILLVAAANFAAAATVGCGRVTTYVQPGSSAALINGDGWLIFAKPDGTSEKVILRAAQVTPVGGISGYVCVGIDGVYFTGLLAPGTAGYIPEPADGITPGTGVYCGIVAANPFTSGQISGPRTYQLRGGLSAFAEGIFSVPTGVALPTIGSYICGRFEPGGPSRLVTLLRAGEPGNLIEALPNTSTSSSAPNSLFGVLGAALLIILGSLVPRTKRP
jgi:hypothetical protein